MALQISKTLNSGVVATYLRIRHIRNRAVPNGGGVPPMDLKTLLMIEYWLDAETRENAKEGENYTALESVNLSTEQIFSDIGSAYNYLKTLGAEISDTTIEDC